LFVQALDGYVCSRPCRILDKHVVISLLTMIDTHFNDSGRTDVVLFHEGYPAKNAISEMRRATSRNVEFVNIDYVFLVPPQGVDPFVDSPPQQSGVYMHVCIACVSVSVRVRKVAFSVQLMCVHLQKWKSI
jgi:hypothetical protein